MDKRLKGDGSVRKILVTMPAVLHRKVKSVAVQADKTIDEVLVDIIEAGVGIGCRKLIDQEAERK